MSEQPWWKRHAVPLVWIGLLTIVGAVFHSRIIGWFAGEEGGKRSAVTTMKVGDITLQAALEPDPPREKGNQLLLSVADADGGAITGAEVAVTVTMPPMGSMSEMRTTARVSERGDGDYLAAFDLGMGGTWTVVVDLASAAGDLSAELKLTVGTPGLVAVGGTGKGAGTALPDHAYDGAARTELERALIAYEEVRRQLAADTVSAVGEHASTVASALRAAQTADAGIPEPIGDHLIAGAGAADSLVRATDLGGARAAFAELSEHLIAAASADRRLLEGSHVFECPMTDGYNKWLQPNTKLTNPYKGAKMLTCGSEIEVEAAIPAGEVSAHVHDPDEIAHYTCPMDTWVKQKQSGTCPVCGMDLVPVTKEEVRTGVMRIDHRRRQLIGLKTGLVERRDLTMRVRAVGRVVYDETRLADVTLKYDGWVEKLLVEETGERVRRGQTLMTVYSPALYTAQQEYLLAVSQRDAAPSDAARQRAELLVRGARTRLELFDVTGAQMARMVKRGEPTQYLPVLAPASGYVVAKDVVQGAGIKQGQRLFRIADLQKVWVEADIYERDIPLVKVGQDVDVTMTHLPGRTFEGKVAFIYPYLDGASRTSRARIELSNEGMELKPDMYANVELRVPLGERLVIPESAVIYSGPRRVVFLDMDDDRLRPLPIEVGVKSDGMFEVLSGLKEGDRVVTSGNFLLSAESRLKAATGLW